MRRMLKYLFLAGIAGATSLAVPGCADNDSGLFVRAILKLDSPQCIAKGDSSATQLLGGVLDLGLRGNYVGALLVGNQLVRRGSTTQLRVETSRILLKGAEITILDENNETALATFSVPGTGYVDPGSGDEPGYGVMFVELIPTSVAAGANGKTVVVEVRVFGDTLGGDEITSAALLFPVSICTGCLVSYPVDADDPSQPGIQCVAGVEASTEDLPCAFGQDDPVDCRSCPAYPVCQGVP